MNWQRWNTASHIFELSTNDGASWSALPLDASILNQGLVATARLGGSTASILKYLRGDQNWRVIDLSELAGTLPFTSITGVATKAQLPAAVAYEDEANSFSLNQLIYKVRPELHVLDSAGGTGRGRILSPIADSATFSQNLSFDGTNWNLDDTSKVGCLLHLTSGQFAFYSATAGANPRSLVLVADILGTGQVDASILSLSGGQIFFPVTQNASGNANALDDYEEGVWTCTDVSGAGLSLTNDISAQYIKIGQLVVANWGVTWPATASGANAALSLPFTAQGTQYDGGVFYNTLIAGLTALVNISAANMSIFDGSVIKTNANLSGKSVRGTAVYRASA